jgi:uncharacterized membrane protein
MTHAFTDQITINRPISEVFEFISDFNNGPKMNEDILNVEKLTEGPLRIGSKFIETRLIRSRNAKATIEVVKYNPSEEFSARSDSNGLIVTYHYQMSEVTDGTAVSFQCEVKTSGIIMSLTKPFLIKILKQEDGDHLKDIKRVMESQDIQ